MYKFEKVNQLLDKFIEMGVPSFDIEIRHKGDKVFRRMHGYSDVEKTKPINGTELYNIYSCSKPITCTAALVLVEQGKLSLSDFAKDYLPEFAKENLILHDGTHPTTDITIEQLFTMSAGLTYDLGSPSVSEARNNPNCCPTLYGASCIARNPLSSNPGTRYEYSLCHDILLAVAEVASGEHFGDFVKREVFDKAEMRETSYLLSDVDTNRLCAQYRYDNNTSKYEPIPTTHNWYRIGTKYESGGAGIVTSVDDYIRFLEALRTGKIISQKTIDNMTTPRIDYGSYSSGYAYGLGVRCPMDASSKSTDFGWGGAAAAYLACDRKCELSIYYAQHVLNSPNQAIRGMLASLAREDIFGVESNHVLSPNANKATY